MRLALDCVKLGDGSRKDRGPVVAGREFGVWKGAALESGVWAAGERGKWEM